MFIFPVGDINPRERTPYLNYLIIAANVAVFLAFGFSDNYAQIVERYGMVPSNMSLLTLFTCMFLHGDVLHLFGNMLFLWICGDNVEDRFGKVGYLLLYFGCGLAASMAHAKMATGEMRFVHTIGASGAIAGILGAYVVLFPKSRIKFIFFVWIFIFIRLYRFTLASFWAIGFWFAKELLFASLTQASQDMTGIAYWAHIGGFVVGAGVTLLLYYVGLVKGGVVTIVEPYREPGQGPDEAQRQVFYHDD